MRRLLLAIWAIVWRAFTPSALWQVLTRGSQEQRDMAAAWRSAHIGYAPYQAGYDLETCLRAIDAAFKRANTDPATGMLKGAQWVQPHFTEIEQ